MAAPCGIPSGNRLDEQLFSLRAIGREWFAFDMPIEAIATAYLPG